MSSGAERRLPGWMTILGGPKQPDRSEFRDNLCKLSADKKELYAQLAHIRDKLGGEKNEVAFRRVNKERDEIRARIAEMEARVKIDCETLSRKNKGKDMKRLRARRHVMNDMIRVLDKEERALQVVEVEVRNELRREQQHVRIRLGSTIEAIDNLRVAFDEQQNAWNEWRLEAQQKYKQKVSAKRKAQREAKEQSERERKMARKMALVSEKLNPFEAEINVCSTLIGYLNDRLDMIERAKQRREMRNKLAAFDAYTTAPEGSVALYRPTDTACEDEWSNSAAPLVSATVAATKIPLKSIHAPEPLQYHSLEKLQLFELVGAEAPREAAQFHNVIKTLHDKKVEYEAHIKTEIDLDTITSDDEDEEEPGPSEDVRPEDVDALEAEAHREVAKMFDDVHPLFGRRDVDFLEW